jgi:hypothetical protein
VAFYGFYRRGENMIANAERDAVGLPALAAVMASRDAILAAVREDLLAAWAVGHRARTRLGAAIAHALRFETWRSLARVEGLADAEAAELMVDLARTAAEPR